MLDKFVSNQLLTYFRSFDSACRCWHVALRSAILRLKTHGVENLHRFSQEVSTAFHAGGVQPLKLADTPNIVPPLEVKSSFAYPDSVYAVLNYRRLLQILNDVSASSGISST